LVNYPNYRWKYRWQLLVPQTLEMVSAYY